MRTTGLLIAVGLVLGVVLLILVGTPIVAQEGAAIQGPQPQNGDTCFATVDKITVYDSADSQAVRDAVAAADDGDLVKVAGYCAGVATVQSVATTVYISDDITLRGGYTNTGWVYDPDTYTTTLDAQRSGRVVYMTGVSSATLDSLTIISGTTSTSGDGAGIYVGSNSVATLTHSTVYSNTSGSAGGGVYVSAEGKLTVTHSAILNNQARWAAGISFHDGSSGYIDHSSIGHNRSTGEAGGMGLSRATVTVEHSTIYSNTSGEYGGGVHNHYGSLRLINSTVSGNQATEGGGIFNNVLALHLTNRSPLAYQVVTGGQAPFADPPEPQLATLVNSTVSRNQAATGAGIHNGYFGELSAIAILSNTIVADQVSGADCSGAITSQGHNLDSDGTCDLEGSLGDVANGSANLGPLQLNAPGDTATHALNFDSDAFDAGDCAGGAVDDDQRGVSRPKGGACDIGAYEFESQPALAVSKTADRLTAGLGSTIEYSYRVTNTGNLPLGSIQATDDPLGTVILDKDTLDPDETTTGTRSHTVVEADLPGPITNTVTASGAPQGGDVVSATDVATVALTSEPAIAVLKSADVVTATVGDTIWYSYLVTNTGNVTLGAVRATDDELGPVALAKTTLAPEEATAASVSYVVANGDLPGPLTNTVIVSGTPPSGPDVIATDDTEVILVQVEPDGYSVFLPLITKNLKP